MHVIERLKRFYTNDEFFIGLSPSQVYILNYDEITRLDSSNVNIKFSSSHVILQGNNFVIVRKSKSELLINGEVKSVERVDA